MQTNPWKIQTPLFPSFAELLGALDVFQCSVQFKVHLIKNVEVITSVNTLSKSMRMAEKTLKLYLFQLTRASTYKKLSPDNVTAAFHRMSEAWLNIPKAERRDLLTLHTVDTYEDSIIALLKDPEALQAARKDVHLSLLEIMEDEFR